MKKFGIFFLKLIIVGGLFGFLFWRAATETNENGQNVFALLWEQPKRWDLLIASFLVQACAASLTFIRWRWLVRAFGLKLSHYDAQRLGFLGLFINLTPLGIVGGDAAKAFFLAGKNDVNCRPQAFASVIVDRMIGLLMMFLFASVTSLLTGFAFQKNVLTQTITYTVFAFTAAGFAGTALVFTPLFSTGHLENLLGKIPYIGSPMAKLADAMLLYRQHKRCLFLTFLFAFTNHFLASISLFLAAKAFFSATPWLPDHTMFLDHIMLYSVLNLTLMIPVAGPFELVFEQIYHQNYLMHVGTGLIVALAYRAVTTMVCGVGFIFVLDGTLKQVKTDIQK